MLLNKEADRTLLHLPLKLHYGVLCSSVWTEGLTRSLLIMWSKFDTCHQFVRLSCGHQVGQVDFRGALSSQTETIITNIDSN